MLVAVAAAMGVFWFSGDSEQIDSLAVLPFENGSADPDAEYFSDGVTESIISSLSQLPNVKVISRNSAFRYKGRTIDAEAVGRELDVEALVLGRIVQRGDELSVSAELVRTRDSGQIWGEQYQLKAADIFTIQEDMAREISDALRLQLTAEQEEVLTKQFTTSSLAYDAYLKGRYHWNRRTEEGIRQAIVYFQEAIRKDPGYALAYSGLADSYTLLGFYYESPRTALPQARAAAERALELDDSLGEAHASLAVVRSIYDWDFAEAEREFLRAIELNPTYETAHHFYSGTLVHTGRFDEAVEQMRIAAELDPLSRIINVMYGQSLGYAGRFEDGDEQLRKTLELDPSWAIGHMRLGQNYELRGLFSEAIPHYEKAVPWCINTGKSLIPLTLLFLHQKRNLLIPLELSRVMHQGTTSPTADSPTAISSCGTSWTAAKTSGSLPAANSPAWRFPASAPEVRMGSEPTSTGISGRARDGWGTASMGSTCSRSTEPVLGRYCFRKCARTSASAAPSATGCS